MRVAVEKGVRCVTLLRIFRPTRGRRLATFDRTDFDGKAGAWRQLIKSFTIEESCWLGELRASEEGVAMHVHK